MELMTFFRGKTRKRTLLEVSIATYGVFAFACLNMLLVFSLIWSFPILDENPGQTLHIEEKSILEENAKNTKIDSNPNETYQNEKTSIVSTILKNAFWGIVFVAGIVTGYYVIKYAIFSDSTEGSVISQKSVEADLRKTVNFMAAAKLLMELHGSQDTSFSFPWDCEVIVKFIQDLESQAYINFRDIGQIKELLLVYYEFPVKLDVPQILCEEIYKTPKFQSIVRALIIYSDIKLHNLAITPEIKEHFDTLEMPTLMTPLTAGYYLHTIIRI